MSPQAEQLARELLREAAFLPERWRLWLLDELRKDLQAFDLEAHRIDQLHQRMSEAVQALDRVADHLQLSEQADRLRLTRKEFDATPEEVRRGWTARQVGRVIRGSWQFAKGVAFGNEILPVAAEVHAREAPRLARKRREGKFTLNAVKAWLESEPEKKTRSAYDAWARARNDERAEGERAIPLGNSLGRRWQVPLAGIIQAVEEDRVPGESREQETQESNPQEAAPTGNRGAAPIPVLNLDARFQGQQFEQAREAKGWSIAELGRRTGIDPSQLSRIEKGQIPSPQFKTLAVLAHTFGLSLDELAIGPTDPPSAK
jgi:DNA-binding XRE family transcriptional regulator